MLSGLRLRLDGTIQEGPTTVPMRTRKTLSLRRLAATALLAATIGSAHAENYPLPGAMELAGFPPAALRFYLVGVQGLDRVDYRGAYENLAKAAQLAPNAVRLNMIVGALALKHGRSEPSDSARDYYETAVYSYSQVLRQPQIPEEFRRDVQNRLKIAVDERDNLSQRDARREGIGGQFILEFNREVAIETPAPDAPAAAPVVPAQPAIPAVPTPVQQQFQQYPQYPQFPGAQPSFPGAPGAPPQQPQPGAFGPDGEPLV